MKTKLIMQCGHPAGYEYKGLPFCFICFGITRKAEKVMEPQPKLEKRVAICNMCGDTKRSSVKLPYFKFNGDMKDTFYCGCRGWN